jgi:hypothetical protein
MDPNNSAVSWLLHSEDPSIRYLTLTEVVDEPEGSKEVQIVKKRLVTGPRVRALLAGQQRDGGFGVHPYQKWTGAHWRLVSLVELGIPRGIRKGVKAADQVLRWLTGGGHRRGIRTVNGRTRRCASQEGNALGVCSYLGIAGDPRVRQLAESLVEWQWPDGGWNCDIRPEANHSSFNESLSTLWGLVQYQRATGDSETSRAIDRAAELFLGHRLFRSDKTGEIINPEWLKLHYPPYWHYDILQALRIIHLAGKLGDPRAKEALDIIESKRLRDGRWRPGGYYWYPKGAVRVMGKKRIVSNLEVVDWGRNGPNEMITLNALRVLKASRRLK